MSDINNNLEQRAAEALNRAKNNGMLSDADTSPLADRIPGQDSGQSFQVPAMPEVHEKPMESRAAAVHHNAFTPGTQIPAAEKEEDDDAIIITGSNESSAPITEDDEMIILSSIAKSNMGDMPGHAQDSFFESIMPEIAAYRKQLILEQGMTPAEAAIAAQNRIKNKAVEANTSWTNEHPEGVIVTIDKSQEENVQFSEDETRKMQTAKALKLVVVERAELEHIKVKPSGGTLDMGRIRDVCGSLSHYSVPMLEYGDYVTFTGAQTGTLANATSNDDDSFVDIIDKKASLLFEHFQKGTVMTRKKTDEHGKSRDMTYDEFCNWYKYDDIDIGIYAIVTASTMETSESTYMCQNQDCGKVYSIKYNNKTLLDLSDLPDEYKHRLEEIDTNRTSIERMTALRDRYALNDRFKSPLSQNIYEVASPTIAAARRRLDLCADKITGSTVLDMLLLLYLDTIYLYDAESEDYIMIRIDDDPVSAFDVICKLHQVDLELLSKWIQEHKYHVNFKIKTKCPHCGREAVDMLNADGMIFLHARASLTEIQ